MGRLSMLLKHFLHNEKPRERFFKYGPSSLSNHELVAILLRNCTKNLFFNYSQDFCNYLAVNMSFVYKRARRNCVVMEEVRFLTHEYFVCLYLNTKNQVLHRLSTHAKCLKKPLNIIVYFRFNVIIWYNK
ncbi:UPF0758 domain-containing protein [Bacillus pumilus]|nr:UPF0758 domain-containing protein [Bacillus pumilus]MDR0122326.1 hypothetical protein [Bacillus pumilus]